MQSLLLLAAVAALSILASNRALLRVGQALGLSQLFASGLAFALLGIAAGPNATALLTQRQLEDLDPVVAVALGFCGLIIGVDLDLTVLRRLPRSVYVAAATQSLAAFAAVTLPVWLVLFLNTTLRLQGAFAAAAILGACASVSSAHLAVLWTRAGRLDRLRGLSLSIIAMLDDVVGMLVLAIGILFGTATMPLSGLYLVIAACGVGVICGAVTAFLIHRLREGPELMAILLGMVAITAGAAAYVRLSTLLAGVFAGATLTLIGGRAVQVAAQAITRLERPVYLALLFLIGAHVKLGLTLTWVVLVLFVALRFVGKVLGGRAAQRRVSGVFPEVRELGYALIAQGGASMCIAMEYFLLVPRPSSQLVLDVAVLAAVLNEVLAARTFPRSFAAPLRPGRANA
ncbi:MAG: sodium:proton exchanger [Myxococcaceae bacterium]